MLRNVIEVWNNTILNVQIGNQLCQLTCNNKFAILVVVYFTLVIVVVVV